MTGKVYLVGAGPGDPGLISIKGIECLKKADLVLYDGLVNPLILKHVSSHCERTCRRKSDHGPFLDQEEINQKLVHSAQEGKVVVRLKGGDPFIFGRGSEEAFALAQAGIPFEIIPGITAAVAAGEYAGISLTHRNIASTVTFITGHEDPDKSHSQVNYKTLAELSGTLVFYMGLHRLSFIVESLIENGKDPKTSACVISHGTWPDQKTVSASLDQLVKKVKEAKLKPPSLIIIGECVSLRDQIAWFEKRPLLGKRIGITRPEGQTEEVISNCIELGAQPVLMPTIQILPVENWDEVDSAIADLPKYDWLIFTSANGVNHFFQRLWELGKDARLLANVKIACIGPATANSLEKYHLHCDLVPDEYRAESLSEKLKPLVSGKNLLWIRASRGRDVLPRKMAEAGAQLDQLVVYQNLDAEPSTYSESLLNEMGNLDWIGVSSPSIARNLVSVLPEAVRNKLGKSVHLASISPVTTAALEESGLKPTCEAVDYTWDGILAAIVNAENKN